MTSVLLCISTMLCVLLVTTLAITRYLYIRCQKLETRDTEYQLTILKQNIRDYEQDDYRFK